MDDATLIRQIGTEFRPLIRLHLNTLDGLLADDAALVTRGKAVTMKLGRLKKARLA